MIENNNEVVEQNDVKSENQEINQEPVKEIEEPKKNKDSNYECVNPYLGKEKKYNGEVDEIADTSPFPSNQNNAYLNYKQELINVLNKMKEGEIDKSAYNKLLNTLIDVSFSKTLPNNELIPEKVDDMVNRVKYSDKVIETSSVTFKHKDKMSKSASIAIFNSILNVGEVVQVPLWHSGFWVTIRPIKERDLINLFKLLRSSTVEMGRYTHTLIYTNYNVIYYKIITEFIKENIVDHSIIIDSSEDIRSYIRIEDINILINGLVSSMYPGGYDISRTCQNSLVFPDANSPEPACDYTSIVKIDTKKLLWVNKKSLTDKMLLQMAKKNSRTVSVDEVKEYQRQLSENVPSKILEINTPNNDKVIIELESPDILTHCAKGDEWIESLVEEAERVLSNNNDADNKNRQILDLVYASRIGLYRSFIRKIKVNDNIETEDQDTIDDFMDIMSASQDTVNEVFKHMTKFKDENTIALIATPSYTCPNCKHVTKGTENIKDFEQLIPLDIVQVFFDLCDIRRAKHGE